MIEFRNREQIESWLVELSINARVAIAARAALRAILALSGSVSLKRFGADVLLPSLRAASIPAIFALSSTGDRDEKFLRNAALASNAVELNPVNLQNLSENAVASIQACSSAATAAYVNPIMSAHAASYAVDSAYHAAMPLNIHDAFIRDVDFLGGWNKDRREELACRMMMLPLWQDELLDARVLEAWRVLKTGLTVDEHWWVWIDWYEDRLHGFINTDRPVVVELERARIEVPQEDWEHPDNPAHVNGIIAGLERKYRGLDPASDDVEEDNNKIDDLPDRDPDTGRFLSSRLPPQKVTGPKYTASLPVDAANDAPEPIDLQDDAYFHRSLLKQAENLLKSCLNAAGKVRQDSEMAHGHADEFKNALGASPEKVRATPLENEARNLKGLHNAHLDLMALSPEKREFEGEPLPIQTAQYLKNLLDTFEAYLKNIEDSEQLTSLPNDGVPTEEDRELGRDARDIVDALNEETDLASEASRHCLETALKESQRVDTRSKPPGGRPFSYLKGALENFGSALGNALVNAGKATGKIVEEKGELVVKGVFTGVGVFAGKEFLAPAAVNLLEKIAIAVRSDVLKDLVGFLRQLL